MSYICGDCHQEHAIPKDDRHVLCVDALADKLRESNLQIEEARKIIKLAHEAGFRFGMGPCSCDWCKTEKR